MDSWGLPYAVSPGFTLVGDDHSALVPCLAFNVDVPCRSSPLSPAGGPRSHCPCVFPRLTRRRIPHAIRAGTARNGPTTTPSQMARSTKTRRMTHTSSEPCHAAARAKLGGPADYGDIRISLVQIHPGGLVLGHAKPNTVGEKLLRGIVPKGAAHHVRLIEPRGPPYHPGTLEVGIFTSVGCVVGVAPVAK